MALSIDSNSPQWALVMVTRINQMFNAFGWPSAVAITGGTIDGTVIGGTTPAAGTFTNLVISGSVTLSGITATTISLAGLGAITSGTYLPTLTAVTNVAASTAYNCQYIRVGNVVNVSGKLDVDPTLTGATLLGISLPIASVLSASEKCSGVAASNAIVSEVAAIDGDIVNNRAQMDWITTSLANHTMYFDFQYLIT